MVKRLDKTVHGNGRPGLVERVAALETVSEATEERLEALAPVTGTKQRGALLASVSALVVALGNAVIGKV